MSARRVWLSTILSGALCMSISASGRDETDSLGRAITWLNSPPLSTQELRGKVVLIDFWTYTCINWRRTMPWLRSWAEKYQDHGLVVIGVHTPEFGFEKDLENVRRAVKDEDVDYPVAIDSEYQIWNAFDNHYWPALYFVDAQGRIRHRQFGEGDYEKLESVIRQLLVEAGHSLPVPQISAPEGHGAEAAADWGNLQSPETYVGFRRSPNLASSGIALPGVSRNYSTPPQLRLNQWGFVGDWKVTEESALLNTAPGRITYRFHARDVHLVMGPGTRGTPVSFRVTINGQAPGASRGEDIDAEGHGTVDMPRMYQLIRQTAPIEDRIFDIEFSAPGAEVYVFTFG